MSKLRQTKTYNHDLPFINMKGALIICLTVIIVPFIGQTVIKNNLISAIICGLTIGYSIAFGTYISSKKGYTKGFWLLFIVFSIISFVVIYLQFAYRVLI